METHSIMPQVVGIIVLVLLSAYFSATETAFTSLNRIRVKNRADSGDRQAKKVLKLENNYDSLLSTILIGNNMVNIAMTAIATVMFVGIYGQKGATISTVVMTLIVLTFGEITPKSLAKENPERFAIFSAPLIGVLRIILTPVNFLFSQWKRLLRALFRSEKMPAVTEDELVTIVDEAYVTGGIDTYQNKLIQNAIEFDDIEAGDVLTPRVDIKAIELDDSEDDIDRMFMETGFSRLPVYEDELDNILGVLNQKDFHNYVYKRGGSVARVMKPVIYVAASMKASDLLRKFQENKCRVAIVVDEYGGTEGIVTSEDIIRELVGEIYDESDTVAETEITRLQDGSYRVLGSANIEKMFDYFGEEVEMDVTTVNGWAAVELDKLPAVGDKFSYTVNDKRFDVHVTKSDGRKALELNVRVTELDDDSKGED
ncbi:MAG: HlyC/CorC family transporter [Eubacterium sp.]